MRPPPNTKTHARTQNLATAFARRFGAALCSRLLHAGAATSDIIATYVSTIRALHTVDSSGACADGKRVGWGSVVVRVGWQRQPAVCEPEGRGVPSPRDAKASPQSSSQTTTPPNQPPNTQHNIHNTPGTLLDAVGEPVRTYLRRRPDTIRAIVSLLTDDSDEGGEGGGGGGGLLEELAAAAMPGGVGGSGGAGSWVGEGEGDEGAIRLLQGLEAGSAAAAAVAPGCQPAACQPDVVALLIGIYGGTGVFLDEYRWAAGLGGWLSLVGCLWLLAWLSLVGCLCLSPRVH